MSHIAYNGVMVSQLIVPNARTAWLSGWDAGFGRRTFPALRSICLTYDHFVSKLSDIAYNGVMVSQLIVPNARTAWLSGWDAGFGRRTFPALRSICLTYDHFVSKLSAIGQPTKPTQPCIPPVPVSE